MPKRTLFTPSTDPTPPPPTALLLFIQRAQMELVYQERTEAEVAKGACGSEARRLALPHSEHPAIRVLEQ